MKRKKCLKQNIKKMWAIWRSYVKKTTERNKKKEKLQLVFQRLRVTSFQGAVYNIYIWYYVYVWLYIYYVVLCVQCAILFNNVLCLDVYESREWSTETFLVYSFWKCEEKLIFFSNVDDYHMMIPFKGLSFVLTRHR